MGKLTFITGNEGKINQLKEHVDFKFKHKNLDLDEIQSLDLKKVVTQKALEAYDIVESPVLVEDVALTYHALGRLPGPLIKWFLEELGTKGLCRLINHYKKDRSATAEVIYCLYDGKQYKYFSSSVKGRIAPYPKGDKGFGWDPVFIPKGSKKTWAQVDEPSKGSSGMRKKAILKINDYYNE